MTKVRQPMHKLREPYGVFVLIKKEMKPRKDEEMSILYIRPLMIVVKKILRMMIMLMCCIIL